MLQYEIYPVFPNFLCIDRVGDINFFHDAGHLTQYDHIQKKWVLKLIFYCHTAKHTKVALFGCWPSADLPAPTE